MLIPSRLSALSALSVVSVMSVMLCGGFAAAQDAMPDMKPAKQVQKFAPLVGTWEGLGLVRHAPEGPEEAWTAKSTARWVLGGHFVREDVRIEMKSMPDPLEFRNLYGWDRENQRFVLVEINNLGVAKLEEVHWTPDGKMVTAGHSKMQGTPIVERWVTELGNGEIRFTGHEAIGDGPFFEHVRGTMRRTNDKPTEINIVNASFAPEISAPAKGHVAKLASIAGSYEMKGWFVPEPGAPKMQFTGSETVEPIFGGTVLEMVSKSDPTEGVPDYRGLAWIAWDDSKGCHSIIYANNMGEVGIQECRFSDGKLVVTTAGLHQGRPGCMRGVIELDENGAFSRYTGHAMSATLPPSEVFGATYRRK